MDFLHTFCKPKQYLNPAITLHTARADRWTIGRSTPRGEHDGGMAMWSEAFAGGLMMGQFICDHPQLFAGKRIADIGCGSGIVSIAAARAGADALAIDSHPWAVAAAHFNAAANGVSIQAAVANGCDTALYTDCDIVIAADIFYVHKDHKNLIETLKKQAMAGKTVYACSQDEDLSRVMNVDVLATGAMVRNLVKLRAEQVLESPRPSSYRFHPRS